MRCVVDDVLGESHLCSFSLVGVLLTNCILILAAVVAVKWEADTNKRGDACRYAKIAATLPPILGYGGVTQRQP